jgi:hypothetical protein
MLLHPHDNLIPPRAYTPSGRRKKVQELKQRSEEVIEMARLTKCITMVAVAVVCLAAHVGEVSAERGEEVRQLIESLEVGEPFSYRNLTIIPVYTDRIRDHTRYTSLDEALDRGWLEVTEVEGGRVPQVRVTNRSGEYIFLMGGEILTGCRQDRLLGRDVLLRPRAKNVIVPVYCVEQGRWTYESETFSSRANLGTSRLRAEGQKAGGDAQSRIWSHVSGMADRAGVASPTGRFQEVYESEETRREISGFRDRMEDIPSLCPDAVGVVIGVGDAITSVDIFANPHVFRALWPKLLRSAALAAVCERAYGTLDQADAVRFLRRVHDKRYTRKAAVDLGFEVSAVDSEVNVNALVYRDAVTHIAGFPEEETYGKRPLPEDIERRIPVIRR